MKAFVACIILVWCFNLVFSDDNCRKFQNSCDACSKAGCRFVWTAPGYYNSSRNAQCVSTAEFQSRAKENQYTKNMWAWALYDSEIKTKMGQRLLKVQDESAYAYQALPIPCYDAHRTFCRQPVGAFIGRTCDTYDNSSLAGVSVTCTANRADGTTVSTTSSDSGFFSFLRLRAGSYRCVATNSLTHQTTNITITIRDKTNTTRDVCLNPLPAAITGRVFDVTTNLTLQNSVVDCRVVDTFRTLSQTNSTFTATGTYFFAGIRVFGPATCEASNVPGGYANNVNTGVTLRGKTIVIDIGLRPLAGRLFGYTLINGTNAPLDLVNVTCTFGALRFSKLTNGSGFYEFNDLPNGTYSCVAFKNEYSGPISASPVVIRGSSTRQDYLFSPLPAALTGRVFDSSNSQSLANAFVLCFVNVNAFVGTQSTNSTGGYLFSPLTVYGPAGCNASLEGYASNSGSGTTSRGLTTRIDIPLTPLPGRLFGLAYLDGSTEPVPGVNITCSGLGNTYSQLTNSSGFYDFGFVANATYSCTARFEGFRIINFQTTPVVFRGKPTRQDYPLVPLPAALVGVVYDSVTGVAIVGARVDCQINDGAYKNSTTTVAAGYYEFYPILHFGVAYCNASFAGYAPSSLDLWNITTMDSVTVINIPLTPLPSRIFGFAYVNGTSQTIQGVNVTCTFGSRVYSMLTNSAGGYDFSPVVNGTYTCSATVQDYFTPPAVQVVVPQATSVRQDFYFRLALGDLVVQVVEAFTSQSVFLPGSTVHLLQNNVVVATNLTTGENSTTVFRRTRPGFYSVNASIADYIPFLQNNALVDTAGQCVNASICPNGVIRVEIVARNSSVWGRIRNTVTGAGISGAQVDLLITRRSGVAIARSLTNDRGVFDIVVDYNTAGGGFGNVLSWELFVTASGFDSQTRTINIPGANRRVGPEDFFMNVTTTGNLIGRVVDSINESLSIQGAVVVISDILKDVNFTAVTNASGMFSFLRVPAGVRSLMLSHPLYNSPDKPIEATVGAGDPGTLKVYSLVRKTGKINIWVWDSAIRNERPGTNGIRVEVPELQVEIQSIDFPNQDVNITLPIGNRGFRVETPNFKTLTFDVEIKEGDNGRLDVYMEYLKRKREEESK